MSPIRRYLRITKYSVLEVRIYLDNPSDVAWLLSSREPVLPRIIQEVRPKVLPKLREENENAKKKTSKKKRGIKDTASQEDFEVTIFLTETSSRHSLLTKQKRLLEKPRLKSTGNKLTNWLNTSDNPIHIEDDAAPQILQEESSDDVLALDHIPDFAKKRGGKRKTPDIEEDDGLFVSSSDEETFMTQRERPAKRRRRRPQKTTNVDAPTLESSEAVEDENDDKKKVGLNTSYDGFTIYGRILCLVVKRKETKVGLSNPAIGSSQMMEQWVSTQAAQEVGLHEDEDV